MMGREGFTVEEGRVYVGGIEGAEGLHRGWGDEAGSKMDLGENPR